MYIRTRYDAGGPFNSITITYDNPYNIARFHLLVDVTVVIFPTILIKEYYPLQNKVLRNKITNFDGRILQFEQNNFNNDFGAFTTSVYSRAFLNPAGNGMTDIYLKKGVGDFLLTTPLAQMIGVTLILFNSKDY